MIMSLEAVEGVGAGESCSHVAGTDFLPPIAYLLCLFLLLGSKPDELSRSLVFVAIRDPAQRPP